jgi:putative NIF3 family GTP cyclohydrolase 1 type 2
MEVNRQAVSASIQCGFGAKKLNSFSEYMNMPGMSSRTFKTHADELQKARAEMKDQAVALAVQAVQEAHRQVNPNFNGNIAVSFDGTWHTRGHSSKTGVACVIDLLTGVCIDWHVMSKFCQKCEKEGAKMKAVGQMAYNQWWNDHQEDCSKNFEGSSGMMEVDGALELWKRSEETHGLRYTTLLSDGDCKTYSVLQKQKPYGENVKIEKEECVNHVAKRLGTALRSLVTDNRKKGVTLGGRGHGKLTQMAMKKLQCYYTKAIRSHKTVQSMSTAVWASLLHCASTDDDPKHESCPVGISSWCFYNRALARGQQPPRHQGNLTTPISRAVFSKLEPVYRRLADPELLKRCTRGKTQNANESLHGVIWSKCSKSVFASREKVEMATLLAVGEFNMGSVASHNMMAAQGLTVGNNTKRLGLNRDMARMSQSQRRQDGLRQRRREKVRIAQEAEQRRNMRVEDGAAYVPGGF